MISESAKRLVDDYLNKVEQQLSTMDPEDRKDILSSLAEHISEAVIERGGQSPATEDVQAVLASMDTPDRFGERARSGSISVEQFTHGDTPREMPLEVRLGWWSLGLVIAAVVLPLIGYFLSLLFRWPDLFAVFTFTGVILIPVAFGLGIGARKTALGKSVIVASVVLALLVLLLVPVRVVSTALSSESPIETEDQSE